ncbi:hypothetical protein [Citrobacter braakii]|uniref:hypothetical protein n=1 Tax=Citrobacter braakii TaxID=57706 RepID=UPI002B2A638D|nr:hypothetical protein R0Q77_13005 [Citrobacter braakii]
MNFNLRIQDGKRFYNDCMNYYYIGTSNTQSIERLQSLSPVTIYGDNFTGLKSSIRAEYKNEQAPQLEMTGALRKRFTLIEQKISELMDHDETIYRVFFHYNSQMRLPMVIVCLGVRTGNMAGIEQGRVIISGVDTVIEENHFVFNKRCDYYQGEWNYITSKSGKFFINVNCAKREYEKPLAYRGK